MFWVAERDGGIRMGVSFSRIWRADAADDVYQKKVQHSANYPEFIVIDYASMDSGGWKLSCFFS